ncbi:MBL fold metallo-hydrolase [Vibrio sinensis]|uniref:MBL fold metallo-hydrolase n=1 Tax=Vibrio sinensis TaxID=2302434 RepID=UPI0014039E45|nr:MBL fold metallo-hydrolase [Vibrio sinensis]
MTVDSTTTDLTKSKTNELTYPIKPDPINGALTFIASGVYLVRMPMDLGLDHINIYLLEDVDGWYVVDTGLATQEVKTIWNKIVNELLFELPIKGLICTHFHYDHASLAPWMMRKFNIPLYMSAGEYLWMRVLADSKTERVSSQLQPFYLTHGVPQDLIDNILSMVESDPLSSIYPSTYNRVREGDVFEIKGRKWQVIMGEGHSPEHICLWSAEDDLLICGDQLLPEISSSVFVNEIEPNANPLKGWLASLEKLQALPKNTLVLPSHGGVFLGLHQRAKIIHSLHQKRLAQLRDVLETQGQCNLYQLMRALFKREMNSMNSMLALGETAAHVNYLLLDKKLKKQHSKDDGTIIYSLSCPSESNI